MRELQIQECIHISGGEISEFISILLPVFGCLTCSAILISALGADIPGLNEFAPIGTIVVVLLYLGLE